MYFPLGDTSTADAIGRIAPASANKCSEMATPVSSAQPGRSVESFLP
ncbi:hypothetical protein RRSWK_03728 [Rhodopirellula sp. SWK7]|nr:hypothetical protein RRSWK_03728 [Rhodopirellula sp. SWK7]